MARLPDPAWWNSVTFTVGAPNANSGRGFSMSRDEMLQSLRLAREMEELVGEQFEAQRSMVHIEPPAADPASHSYLGTGESSADGVRMAGERYRARLAEQADYLNRLIDKLADALSAVHVTDDDIADGFSRDTGPWV